MNLRNFYHNKPRPSDIVVPVFKRSVVTDSTEVSSHRGHDVKTTKRISKLEVIPPEEFENRGYDSDLFSVSALKSNGIDLFKEKPITTPLFSPTIDTIGDVKEKLDNFDYSVLTEKDFEDTNN